MAVADDLLREGLRAKIGEIDAELDRLADVSVRIKALEARRTLYAETMASLGEQAPRQDKRTPTSNNGGAAFNASGMGAKDTVLQIFRLSGPDWASVGDVLRKAKKFGWTTRSDQPHVVIRSVLERFCDRGEFERQKTADGVRYRPKAGTQIDSLFVAS